MAVSVLYYIRGGGVQINGSATPTYFDPEILGIAVVGPAQAAQTYLPAFTFDFSNTNVLKINKLNFLGTGGSYLISVRKSSGPWS
jgi:hypothetical protein